MSKVSTVSNRFWKELDTSAFGEMSEAQRAELERSLGKIDTPANPDIKEMRLSFGWFFVRISWGAEKRNRERLRKEREQYPTTFRHHLPALTSIFVGTLGFFYVALALGAVTVAYFMS